MKRFALIIGLLLVIGSAYAGVTQFYLEGFNNGSQTDWQDGYPYYAKIGNDPTNVFVLCDDWLAGGEPGDKFPVYATNLASSNLSDLRFINQPGGLMLYEEAGWLVWETQFYINNQSDLTAMNEAVWNIFEPGSGAPCPGGGTGSCQYWLAQAGSNYGTLDRTKIEVFTPVNNPNEQEFLCLWNGNSCPAAPPVPEPGTFLLLGTGLLGWVGRKLLS